MKHNFDFFFEALLLNEGVYSNDPHDAGGKTIYGIASKYYPKAFADVYTLWQNGSLTMARETAKQFFYTTFYNKLYDQLPVRVAWKLFDLGVNMGVGTAVKLFQKTLNEFEGNKIEVDGVFGQKTLDKFKELTELVVSDEVFRRYIQMVWKRYKLLRVFKRFGSGWRARLLRTITVASSEHKSFVGSAKIILKRQIVGTDLSYYFVEFDPIELKL